MRTKLFGAFIAVLALGVLPASAMAAPAQIRSGGVNATIGHTVKAHSVNLEFGRAGGLTFSCEASSIDTEVTVADELSIIGGVFEPMFCSTPSPRIEIRISPNLSGSIRFESEEGSIYGFGSWNFTFKVWDRGISTTSPIGVCRYQGSLETESESGSGELEVVEAGSEWTLQVGSAGSCEPSGKLKGNLTLSRRDNTAVTID